MTPEIGGRLEISGKTGLGRQLVRKYGAHWSILALSDRVPHDRRSGDWAQIAPANDNEAFKLWILLCQDYHIGVLTYAS